MWLKRVLGGVIMLAFFGLVGYYFVQTQIPGYVRLTSAAGEKRQVLSANIWFPQDQISTDNPDLPDLTAKAIYFVDIDSGQVLFQRQPHTRLPVASLVKIMTAIVTLERQPWEASFTVSNYASGMEPDHMGLLEGESLTTLELMSGLFLVSANDASEVFAESVMLSRPDFIEQMNQKAKQIGMANSWFINPSGLEEDGVSQHSTAYDVALMSRFAIVNFPKLVDITSQPEIMVPANEFHREYYLPSGINLVTTYPGVKGFKTGYTPEAGMTLVTYAEKGGHRIVGVILNSENRRDEARQLLDYSFQKLGVTD